MKNSPSSITQAIDSINLSGTLTTSGRVNKYDGHFEWKEFEGPVLFARLRLRMELKH